MTKRESMVKEILAEIKTTGEAYCLQVVAEKIYDKYVLTTGTGKVEELEKERNKYDELETVWKKSKRKIGYLVDKLSTAENERDATARYSRVIDNRNTKLKEELKKARGEK